MLKNLIVVKTLRAILAATMLVTIAGSVSAQSADRGWGELPGWAYSGTCIGEAIDYSLPYHWVRTSFWNGEHFLYVYSVNTYNATGTGQTTGGMYRFMLNDKDSWTLIGGDGLASEWGQRYRVIGQGDLPDFYLRHQVLYTVNANGEVTAEPLFHEITCKD